MKRILFIILLIFISYNIRSQNPVTVQILVHPPYSSHIEDYTSYENKLVLILTGQYRSSNEPYQVYFKGFLEGDNGVRVETDENYKPPTPVEIPAGGSISFNGNELDFFSSEHMIVTGTTTKEIILGDGLPEGYYHICVRAYDYYTDEALSADEPIGCSADFGIFHIDPPEILYPVCGDSIQATESQNIVFTWTIPVNSPPNIQYTFTLTELQDGQNPEDATESMTYPPFFETNTQSNSYSYTMADPPLEKGQTYVAQVRAFDPEEKTGFNNNGYSEVCTFTYGKKITLFDGVDISKVDTNINIFQIDTVTVPDIDVTPKFVSTKICGKILYKYPYDNATETYPMVKANVKLIVDYVLEDPSGQLGQNVYQKDDYGTGIEPGFVLDVTQTAKDGSYCFDFINNIKLGHVTDYIAPSVKMFAPVPVYRVLRVEIEAPHTMYYEDYSINSNIVDIGKQSDNIDFMFLVKAFNFDVKVKWNDLWVKLFDAEKIYATDKVVGAPVYIFRKKKFNFMGLSPFPHEDGAPKEYKNKNEYLDVANDLELIANTTTDDKGVAHFKRLVDNHDPNYQYYIYLAPSGTGTNNFKPYGPRLIRIPNDWNEGQKGIVIDEANPHTLTYKVGLDQEFPAITGIIVDEDNNHAPIENVKIILDELYFASNNYYLKYQTNPENIFERQLHDKIKNKECPCAKHVYRFNLFGTGKDGKFSFNNLAILYSQDKLYGNFFGLKLDKPGYEVAKQQGRLNAKTYVGSKALRMGEKMNLIISMKRGARISGRVVDAESNIPVEGARIMIIPDQIAKETGANGEFSDYPALRLPGKEQLLVVEKANYVPDTFKVIIDKGNQDLGVFKIFKLKRRLSVTVVDKNTGKPVNGALVVLKGVKGACLFSSNNNCPVWGMTEGTGLVFFKFDNAVEQHEVAVTVPDGLKNYEPQTVTVNIPLSKTPTKLKIYLNPATCLKGRIYAGESDKIPLDGVIVKEKLSNSGGNGIFTMLQFDNNDDSLSVYSDAQGYYFKRNVPLGLFKKTYVAAKSKSQYIGDKWQVLLNEPRDTNNCIVHDFHLKVYDDMDITHLMGFPIYITDLKSISHKKAEITGGFVDIPGNKQFSIDKNIELEFGKITITAGDIPPGDTLPVAIPSKSTIVTDQNSLDVNIEKIDAVLHTKNGIAIVPKQASAFKGIIKGKVHLNNKYFNINNISLPEIYIADAKKNVNVTVFSADKNDTDPLGKIKRIPIADKDGKSLIYTLFDFHQAEANIEKSGIEDGKLVLNTILHSDIESISPKDIKLNIGDITIDKNAIAKISNNKFISMDLGKWTMKSNDWKFDEDGLIMKKGFIDATGFQLKFDNFRIRENQLDGALAKFHFDEVKLLGIKKMNIVSEEAGFSYVNVHGEHKAYQIDIKKNNQYGYCAYLDKLPGMQDDDIIPFPFIMLRSDGNSLYPLGSKYIKLFDIVGFRPDANSVMDVTSQLFQIHGNLILNYPKVSSIATNISFQNDNGQLKFGLNSTHPINFTNNGLVTKLDNVKLSYHLLTATGTVKEPGAFPRTKVVLTHTPQKIQVDIAKNEKIQISSSNYFSDVIGEMHVAGDKWTTFWFEGYPMGMKGISDNNPKKMKFTVNGVVTATGQSISVKKVKTPFGEMRFSYNLPKSELIGYCKIDKTVGGVGLKGGVETLVNMNGWVFTTTGTVTIPSFGEVNLFGLLGDYDGTSSLSQANYGGFSCLPPAFQNKISGFLIAGYFQRNFFDPIDEDFVLVTVKAGLDVGLAARFFTNFDDTGTTIGLGLKLYGHAYFEGSFTPTCTSVGVNAEAMLGVNSTYNTKTKYFSIDGCAGLSVTLYGEQCLGLGACSDVCASVNVGTMSLSATIKGDSNGDLDYVLKKKYCSDCD